MKKPLVLLLIASSCLLAGELYCQSSDTRATLDKMIAHAQNASLYRQHVDWDVLQKEMYRLSENAQTTQDLKPALDLMLAQLEDSHGRVFHNNKYLSYYSGGKKEHRASMDNDTYNQIQSGQVYPFRAMLLEDGIGYVRIVGLPMGDNTRMSKDIQDAVCAVIAQGATRWIVDLRYNGGGNMFPMVEGLTSLIGDGPAGGTQGVTQEESAVWQIENGHFYYDQQTVALENDCSLDPLPPIAVLTSVYTASSGEALAVILKQRPHTRFFGNKTMGMITATDWKQIDSTTFMSISVSYYKDRANTIYDRYVDVDEPFDFEPDAAMDQDAALGRALIWLKE